MILKHCGVSDCSPDTLVYHIAALIVAILYCSCRLEAAELRRKLSLAEKALAVPSDVGAAFAGKPTVSLQFISYVK